MTYYYITTFPTEVNLFWNRKLNGTTLLFLANRSVLLWLKILEVPTAFVISDEVRSGRRITLRRAIKQLTGAFVR